MSTIDPAPTVLLSTHYGSCHSWQVLPDSGGDISAAGEHVLPLFNEHKDNLLPSEFTPCAARMHAIEKMHAFSLLEINTKRSSHTCVMSHLRDVIISWRAAKALQLLLPHYPLPPPVPAPSEPRIWTTIAYPNTG